MKQRIAFLIYATVAYILAMANIAYLIGFLADFGVPKGINDGPSGSIWLAVVVDIGLVALFGLHHSTTARRWFKDWWTGYVPKEIERATYLYMTAAMTLVLVAFWRPIPITIWQIDSSIASGVIVASYLGVWAMMFASTFHFGHLGFFGLQQAWDYYRSQQPGRVSFTSRYLYALVRHPISLGWMLAPWLTPHMTLGQLLFALSVTAYVLVVTPFEEADLIEELGDVYKKYRTRVPAFVPGTRSLGDEVKPSRRMWVRLAGR